MVGFRDQECTIHKNEKNKPSFFEDFSPIALFLELVTTLFIINPNFLKRATILFEKSQQSFFFLPIPLSLLLIYYYSATYKIKKQIFLLYLSIYY